MQSSARSHLLRDAVMKATASAMGTNCLPGWQQDLYKASRYVGDPAYGNYPTWTYAPHVTGPDLAVAQPMMKYGAQGPGFAAPQMPLHRDMQHAAPQEAPPASSGEESPIYVNSKQFDRILKRRVARHFEEHFKPSKSRKAYLHESRKKHADTRPRDPRGRFLTADEFVKHKQKAGSKNMAMARTVTHQKVTNS